jgi:hypothetical protein
MLQNTKKKKKNKYKQAPNLSDQMNICIATLYGNTGLTSYSEWKLYPVKLSTTNQLSSLVTEAKRL